MIHCICTAAALFLVICGLLSTIGLFVLGWYAIIAVLQIPPWVPLAFIALVSIAGAIAERGNK